MVRNVENSKPILVLKVGYLGSQMKPQKSKDWRKRKLKEMHNLADNQPWTKYFIIDIR